MSNTDKLANILEVQGIHAKGFGTIPKIVMQDRRLKPTAKAIYAYFCSYAGAGSTAFPSVNKIIYDLNMNKDTYYKHLDVLKDCGYVTVTPNRAEGNKFDNNIYTLIFNPVAKVAEEEKKPCPKKSETGKKPFPKISDTEKSDTNIINNTINKNINNNNNNATAPDENIFENKMLNDIVSSFNDKEKEVVKAFINTTTCNIVPNTLYGLQTLVQQHGFDFVYHAITRANKDININYLKTTLNSSSYQGKSSVEEVEKAIADYNKPKVVKRSATKKVIRQEIVPDWLKQQNEAQYQSQTQTTLSNQVEEPTPDWLKQQNEAQYQSQTQTTLSNQVEEPTPDWLKQQNELQYQNETTTVEEPTQTKSVEDIIREFSFAPFNTIMFQLEQHGYERTTDLINKVMQFKEPTF